MLQNTARNPFAADQIMKRPPREEKLNTATHGLGVVLGLIGSTVLLNRVHQQQPFAIVYCAFAVYCFSLVGVFVGSTLSHYFLEEPKRTQFRKLDQAFIYLLIVGTYTPFSVVFLKSNFSWILLTAMWVVALIGFISKLFLSHRVNSVSLIIYIVLGWMPILGGSASWNSAPASALWGGLFGGVLYTVGTLFLKYDTKAWYFHGIWHVFVILAAAVHWWVHFTYVATGQ